MKLRVAGVGRRQRVFAPTLVGTRLQLVAGTVIEQLALPSLTVTVPVGVPVPGGVTATLAVTATGAPTSDGFGVCALRVEVVLALTVCATPGEVLPLKLASPA